MFALDHVGGTDRLDAPAAGTVKAEAETQPQTLPVASPAAIPRNTAAAPIASEPSLAEKLRQSRAQMTGGEPEAQEDLF